MAEAVPRGPTSTKPYKVYKVWWRVAGRGGSPVDRARSYTVPPGTPGYPAVSEGIPGDARGIPGDARGIPGDDRVYPGMLGYTRGRSG